MKIGLILIKGEMFRRQRKCGYVILQMFRSRILVIEPCGRTGGGTNTRLLFAAQSCLWDQYLEIAPFGRTSMPIALPLSCRQFPAKLALIIYRYKGDLPRPTGSNGLLLFPYTFVSLPVYVYVCQKTMSVFVPT